MVCELYVDKTVVQKIRLGVDIIKLQFKCRCQCMCYTLFFKEGDIFNALPA